MREELASNWKETSKQLWEEILNETCKKLGMNLKKHEHGLFNYYISHILDIKPVPSPDSQFITDSSPFLFLFLVPDCQID